MGDNIIGKFLLSLGFTVDSGSASKATKAINDVKNAADNSQVSLTQFGDVVKKVLGFAGITLSAAGLISYGKAAIDAASELEQMEEKFEAVFLELSDEADEWAGNLADSIGRSKNSIKTYLADQQNLLVGFGMERDAAMELSEEMTSAAINIASFNNIDDDTAVNAMSKALMGQTESAKTLGAVLNDNTIAMAMADLGYQQSFSDLDEATKMQVRFHSIVMQSPDAFREENGVIGDAALSMDTYESRLRQFNATMTDIKTNIGKFILPYAAKILEYVSKAGSYVRKLTEKLGDANKEGTAANKVLKSLDKFLQYVTNNIKKCIDVGKKLINFFGGLENVIQIIVVALGTLYAMKIAKKIQDVVTKAGGLKKMLTAVHFKTVAIVAAVVAVFLIIQDLVYFLQGKDSLIGDLINANGGDADKVRGVFQNIVTTIKSAASSIATALEPVRQALAGFWDEHGAAILQAGAEFLEGVFSVIIGLIAGFGASIAPLIETVKSYFKLLGDLLTRNWDAAAVDLLEVFAGISDALAAFWDSFATVVNNMLGIHLPEDLKQLGVDAMNALLNGLQSVWSSITSFFDNIVTTVTTTIGELPGKMLQWGKDMISNFISGLEEVPVVGTVVKIAEDVSSKLHHSTPDDGPLKDDDEWGYDFMDNFIIGIEGRKDALRNTINGVADLVANSSSGIDGISTTVTGAMATSGMTRNNSIIQNVTFSNTFNGDTRSNQTAAASAMKRNADDTTALLSRGIALAR